MGLYSVTNKLALIEGGYDGTDYLADVQEDTEFIGSTLNCVIQLTEHAYKMFDTLIDMDYTDAALARRSVNEADDIGTEDKSSESGSNKEAKKNGILAKAREIIDSVINAIKQVATKFIAKIISLVKSDKKIIAKYKPAIQKADFSNWNGISNFSVPTLDKNGIGNAFANDTNTFLNYINKLDNATSKDQISTIVEEAKKAINGDSDDEKKEESEEKKIKENWKPDKNTILKLVSELENGNQIIGTVKNSSNTVINLLNSSKNVAKDNQNSSDNEFDTTKANAVYTLTNFAMRKLNKKYNKVIHDTTKYISKVRQAVILAGRYAISQTKGSKSEESTTESVDLTEFMIREASDMYVYEMLDMQQ